MQALQEQPTTVDFAHYKDVLRNTAVVDEVEGKMKAYTVQKYDLTRQVKAIESFEVSSRLIALFGSCIWSVEVVG